MMISLFLLFTFLAQLNAQTTWYAAYDLTPNEISSLTDAKCYRGIFGELNLLTCPYKDAQQFAVLDDDAYLCVVDLTHSKHVGKAVAVMSLHNVSDQLIYTGRQEIVFYSTDDEKPELCDAYHFEEVNNAVNVPHTPIVAQRSPPVDHPAYIKSILNKEKLVVDPYIEHLLTTFLKENVVDEVRTLSTGFDGSNTKITRNSYSIAVGIAGCADESWNCAKDATKYVIDRLNLLFQNYQYEWSVTSSSFRADMCHNIILDISGATEPGKYVLGGAHLDSRNTGSSPNAQGIAPGADDNGTGSATLLAIARLIAENNVRFAYSVRLMWFCGEEQGLIGSRELANLYRGQGLDVLGMFNMDMIGYTDPSIGVTLAFDARSQTPWLTQSCKDFTRTYFPNLPIGDSTGCCSDSQSFFNAGFPALGIFETPTPSVRYPYYHQTGDQWNNPYINYDQVWQFGQAVTSCILEYGVPLPDIDRSK